MKELLSPTLPARILFIFALLPSLPLPASAQFTKIDAGLSGVGDAALEWVDYDVDGDLDVVITGQSSGGVITHLYRNDGGKFVRVQNTPFIPVSLGKVAFGDYDNDGDPDLLLTGQKADGFATTQMYRNDTGSGSGTGTGSGSGTFVDINAGITALKAGMAAWRDYDGDGDLDFFISGADNDGNTQSKIYRNDEGSFTDIGANIKGLRRGDVSWVDIDRDGDPDLLLSGRDSADKRWTLLYKNDQGKFSEVETSLPQVDLGALAWGNYKESYWQTLFVSGTVGNGHIGRVYEYRINPFSGPEGFVEIGADIEALEFSAAAWGDYDNDNKSELVILGRNHDGLQRTRLYDQTSGPSALGDVDAGFPGLYKGDLAWGDYDNDGALDLIIAGFDSDDQPVTKLYRNTTGSINTPPDPPLNLWVTGNNETTKLHWSQALSTSGTPGALTYNVRIGTSSGASDVFSSHALPNGKRLLPLSGNADESQTLDVGLLPAGAYYWSVQSIDYGLAASAFPAEHAFRISPKTPFIDTGIQFTPDKIPTAWADVDNDGDLDILLDSDLFENQNGTFSAMNSGISAARIPNDFDGDGDLDVLAYHDGGATLYRNNNGIFNSLDLTFDKPFAFQYSSADPAQIGDFDNDGDEDILVAVDDGSFDTYGAAYLFENEAGDYLETGKLWGPVFHLGSPVVADQDNDGDLDFFISGVDSYIYKAEGSSLLNNTGDAFTIVNRNLPQTAHGLSAWGDIDGDGDLDLIISGEKYGTERPPIIVYHTLIMRNEGKSRFTKIAELTPTVHEHLTLGDYDNDGDPDLFLSGPHGATLYENDNGSFVNIAGVFDGLNVRHTALGDYDNDGDLDALISTQSADDGIVVRLFKNNSGPKNDPPSTPAGLNISVDGDAVTFCWNAADDEETSSKGLTYNLRIGTEPGQGNVMPAHAHKNGTRLVPRMGNVNHNTSWTIKGLKDGKYYWSVQAVDAGYMASPFAGEQILNLPDPTIPVELTSFDGLAVGDRVILTWNTASEINNAGFEVERALEDGSFARIAHVAGHGSTTEPQAYRFEDETLPFGANRLRYRLKQIDFDGRFEYSPVVTVDRSLPESLRLFPNYPNPFNPTTEIRYTLPVGTDVRLAVYDVTGKQVALLIRSFQEAGRHEVSFDGSRLASGVYVYVLQTPGEVIKRQMVLMK